MQNEDLYIEINFLLIYKVSWSDEIYCHTFVTKDDLLKYLNNYKQIDSFKICKISQTFIDFDKLSVI